MSTTVDRHVGVWSATLYKVQVSVRNQWETVRTYGDGDYDYAQDYADALLEPWRIIEDYQTHRVTEMDRGPA
jgi:hypothetical protein